MRIILLLAALALSACGATTDVVRGRMPLNILRDEGQPPRMADPTLVAGGGTEDRTAFFYINFENAGTELGAPKSVGWDMNFGAYCRNQYTFVHAVLTDSNGREWAGQTEGISPGPDRSTTSAGGFIARPNAYEAQPTPSLLEAVTAGGRFTLALEDQDGHRWGATIIDSLTPAERDKLFAANLTAFKAVDPATFPVKEQMYTVRTSQPAPWPPRPCPGS